MTYQRIVCLLSALLSGWLSAGPPVIVSQSGSMDAREGDGFAAYVGATGEALSYQWFHDGTMVGGETGATLMLDKVKLSDAGNYHVMVSNAEGSMGSEVIVLGITPRPALGISAGSSGIVAVPGQPAYYELYLPSSYGSRGAMSPVLFTFSPSGGGMVGHFRNVAEQKGWIVVGVSQSRNGQGFEQNLIYHRAVFEHALDNLLIDPNRIFVAGMSGGGWASFMASKRHAPFVAGVLSMGGWLGREYSMQRDIYLPGLLVARANGDADSAANSWLSFDRGHLTNWISSDSIRDWSFPGGHVPSPESVQREVFDWFMSLTSPSSVAQRDFAREQEALWKAQITAGEGREVFEEMVYTAFNLPRTPDALAAWRTMNFLFAEDGQFLRETPPDFADFPGKNFLAVHLYHSLFAFMQRRDPSMQLSAAAAARALGEVWELVQDDPQAEDSHAEADTILRHPVHSRFDDFVLEHGLYDRSEAPVTGDWDGDGRDNFGEFTLGTSPLVVDGPANQTLSIRSGGAFLTLAGCRPGPLARLAAVVRSDLGGDDWSEVAAGSQWLQPIGDGRFSMACRIGDPVLEPRRFARFTASMSTGGPWHDANGDGIPYEYQFPGGALDGDSDDLPDARGETVVPGGAPLYLRYLTAADIGPANTLDASLRWHPALAGYRGYLYHEVWMNVPGSGLTGVEAAVLDRLPNEVRLITSSQAPWFSDAGAALLGDNYFERSRGYIVPDVSGDYVFSIAGDDQCELWLSTNASPDNANRIARVSGFTSFQNFTQSAEQSSAPIRLRGGQSYYVKLLHKDGNGADHCTVAWIPPGASTRSIIPSENLRCLTLDLIDLADE